MKCKNCKYWTQKKESVWGECYSLSNKELVDPVFDSYTDAGIDSFETNKDFGCIEFKELKYTVGMQKSDNINGSS